MTTHLPYRGFPGAEGTHLTPDSYLRRSLEGGLRLGQVLLFVVEDDRTRTKVEGIIQGALENPLQVPQLSVHRLSHFTCTLPRPRPGSTTPSRGKPYTQAACHL